MSDSSAMLWTITHQAPVPGISQARILEWVSISFSRGSSRHRDQTSVSCRGRFFTTEPLMKPHLLIFKRNEKENIFTDLWMRAIGTMLTAPNEYELPLSKNSQVTLGKSYDIYTFLPPHLSWNSGNQSWIFIGRTDAEAEAPILLLPDVESWLLRKHSDAGKDWRQEKKGMTEDMVGWHHRLDGHEFEQASGVGDGQGSLVCCSPWGHKGSDMTEQLNWTDSPPHL